jgi:hypothetical protein
VRLERSLKIVLMRACHGSVHGGGATNLQGIKIRHNIKKQTEQQWEQQLEEHMWRDVEKVVYTSYTMAFGSFSSPPCNFQPPVQPRQILSVESFLSLFCTSLLNLGPECMSEIQKRYTYIGSEGGDYKGAGVF